MTLSITQASPSSPADIEACRVVVERSIDHDLPGFPKPTYESLRLSHKHGWSGREYERYLAWIDGEPAGRIEINFTTIENLGNAGFMLDVVPAFRRRGIGRALFEKVVERARARGRTKLIGTTVWELPGIKAHDGGAGPAFAAAMGFENANLPEVMRRLDLSTLDNEHLDEMFEKAKARSAGYRLVRWGDRTPDELVADVAYLDSRLMTDAPMGDLDMEPEKVDADRVREMEELIKLRGRTSYHTGAVHEETGRLVAWTTLAREDLDWHCWQQITIVEPKHRGHRLGALVKIANLRWYLESEPATKVIDTFNAHVNSYMISINEEMGFRPILAFQNWQRDL